MSELDNVDSNVEDQDPFSPANAMALNLVVSMRLYDVMLALLSHFDEETADEIVEYHERGKIVFDLPYFTGPNVPGEDVPVEGAEGDETA